MIEMQRKTGLVAKSRDRRGGEKPTNPQTPQENLNKQVQETGTDSLFGSLKSVSALKIPTDAGSVGPNSDSDWTTPRARPIRRWDLLFRQFVFIVYGGGKTSWPTVPAFCGSNAIVPVFHQIHRHDFKLPKSSQSLFFAQVLSRVKMFLGGCGCLFRSLFILHPSSFILSTCEAEK
ncbi:MAG: hypothetical protein NTZ09_10095 [Candidatus Hydrogenedentes bacterium]|nr:hypothetical protein [Candidatus Hydrogenedentota bacterium]